MSADAYEYDVFISFASNDQDLVRPLWQDLTTSGLRVFWSDSSLRDSVGSSWFDVIQRSVIRSRHLVVVFTPSALKSEWVRREYVAFFSHYYRPPGRLLIPVIAGQCDLNDLPLFLRELESCRLDANAAKRLIRLLGGIDVEALRIQLAERDDEIRGLRMERDSLQVRVSALAQRVASDGASRSREMELDRTERTKLLSKVQELERSINDGSGAASTAALPSSPSHPNVPRAGPRDTAGGGEKSWISEGGKVYLVATIINVILLSGLGLLEPPDWRIPPSLLLTVVFGTGLLWFVAGAVSYRKSRGILWISAPATAVLCIGAVVGGVDGYILAIVADGLVAVIGLMLGSLQKAAYGTA